MDKDSLRERLTKLHAELRDAHREDPAARRSLGEILPDIERIVGEPSRAGAARTNATGAAHASLPDRLERVALQFEAEHPTLAASARRLIDLLAEAGI